MRRGGDGAVAQRARGACHGGLRGRQRARLGRARAAGCERSACARRARAVRVRARRHAGDGRGGRRRARVRRAQDGTPAARRARARPAGRARRAPARAAHRLVRPPDTPRHPPSPPVTRQTVTTSVPPTLCSHRPYLRTYDTLAPWRRNLTLSVCVNNRRAVIAHIENCSTL